MVNEKNGLVRKAGNRKSIDWKNIVIPRIAELRDEYIGRVGLKPTIRSMYYIGLEENLYPATIASYKGLVSAIVREKDAGRFREDSFTDDTRFVWKDFPLRDRYITQEEWVDDIIDTLKNADEYYKYPRWRGQPCHIMAVLEKNTLFGVFKKILKGLEIPIIVNKGNRGRQFLTDTLDELEEFFTDIKAQKCEECYDAETGEEDNPDATCCNVSTGTLLCQECKVESIEESKKVGLVQKWADIEKLKKIVLLYFGDCDPSGDNMSVTLTSDIINRRLDDHVILVRIAVNFEQITEYGLACFPQDLDTMSKLLADPNIERFTRKLRTSTNYRKIKAQLDGDPDYTALKNQLINHSKVVDRLKKKAKRYHKDYETLRAAELRKIARCDFIIYELDALAAKKHDILKTIVLDAIKEHFKEDIHKELLKKHKIERILGLVHKKIKFLDDDN